MECPPSPRLIKAAWPKPQQTDASAEDAFLRIQEIVGAIRNVRNEYKVEPKRPVTVSIVTDLQTGWLIEYDAKSTIELLGICKIDDGQRKIPDNAVRIAAGGCEVFIEGVKDETADRERQAKRCEELKRQITALRGRLANESYTKKAPPHLVKQTQDQLAEAESEAAKLGCA